MTLDAIAQLGRNARGVAVIHPTVTDAELKTLDHGGIRGIRFSLSSNPTTVAATTVDMIEPLSKRVNALGWHVQIAMDADQIVAAESLWNRIPSAIVFDHMGYVPEPMGTKHPAFALIRKLIDKGRTWVKLSVIPANTKDEPPTYADVRTRSVKLMCKQRQNGLYGAAIGRILTKPTHRTTRYPLRLACSVGTQPSNPSPHSCGES